MLNIVLISLASFSAAGLGALAIGLSAHTALGRRRDLTLRIAEEPALELPPRLEARQPIDRTFFELWEAAGEPCSPSAALLLIVGGAAIGGAAPLAFFGSLPGAMVGVIVGALVPVIVGLVLVARRRAKMQRNLADTLELLADAVRSGGNLEQATALVARQAASPLDDEFARCATQLRLGQSAAAVLASLTRRVPLAELRAFAVASAVHRQTGGNLALLVERLAQSARERQEFHGHLQAVTAGSRLSAVGLVLATIAAVGLLAGMQPEYFDLLVNHPYGAPLLATAAALQLLGIVWVSRLLKIEF